MYYFEWVPVVNYTITASAGSGGGISPNGSFTKAAGSSQAFTASPNANYVVNQWRVDGGVVQNGGNAYTLSNIQANRSVQVTFTYVPPQYTITASAGSGGGISPNGSFTKSAGSSQAFTASPNANYVVNQWLVDGGVVQNGGNGYTLSNIQANRSVQVTFTYVPPQYTITASAGSGGGISPNGSFTKAAGSSQEFTASPNVNYVVNQWLVDGGVVQNGGTGYTLSNIQANRSVQVTFTYVPPQYTITASAGSGGGISPNGSITKNAGDSQAFTASPNANYVVNQWLVDGGVVQNGGTGYTLSNIQANRSVQVTFTFAPTQYTITASAGAGGNISPNGSFTKAAGSSQAFTASPNANYVVNQWLVDGGVVQNGSNGYTLSNIQDNRSVQVTFTYVPPGIQPRQLTGMGLSNGVFRFVLNGPVGSNYVIQVSSNAVNWLPLVTNVIPASGSVLITDPATGQAKRFYRAVGGNTSVAPTNMVLIPAGSFEMGDSLDGDTSAQPVHMVNVSAFYMDKYEVTKALWDEVHDWAISRPVGLRYSFEYGAQGKAANHPAQWMTWYDAVKWCNARSEKEGRLAAYYTSAAQTTVYRSGQVNVENDWVKWTAGGYRLPTEAEWEKAARGGASGQRFPWGNTITHSQANYYSESFYPYDTSSTRGYHPSFNTGGYPYTSPVGYFAPNGYGLYDMAGNVWEWCWDWYQSNWYGQAGASQNDTRGPSGALSNRVLRGGVWNDPAYYMRCAVRVVKAPDLADGYFGFRCVRGL